MKNILFFGNSLTAGYGLANPSLESYPALINKKLISAGLKYQVINAGVSGDTSAGGLRRIDYWLNRPVEVFVLELGINDIIRGIPPKTIQDNLQEIINRVKSRYPFVKLVLMGMQLPDYLPVPFAGPFNRVYGTLAANNNMGFVPFFLKDVAGKAHLNLPDRLHPSAEGYKIIAENVWPVIEKTIINN